MTKRCDNFPCDYACLRRNACDIEERARLEQLRLLANSPTPKELGQ